MLTTNDIIVSRADLQSLIAEVRELRNQVTGASLREKLDLLIDGPVITSREVMKIMQWSRDTFWRRLKDPDEDLIMKKDGHKYKMTKEDFIEYYNNKFKPLEL